ncbi:MAG: lipopolysaccharide kinase InaA family protein [Phycisphaerae bacterium]
MTAYSEHVVISPEDRAWCPKTWLGSVAGVLEHRPAEVKAVSGSSETFAVEPAPAPDAPRSIFVKRYVYRTWQARIKGALRGTVIGASRARFEYEFLRGMRQRDVPAVRPIAYGERRRSGVLEACFLVTEGVIGAKSLDAYVHEWLTAADPASSQRRRFVEALAVTLRHMHQAGITHGGLYWRNILVAEDPEIGWRFYLIDPDRRGRCYPTDVPRAAILSDLADFAATSMGFSRRSDVVTFARAYFDVQRLRGSEKHVLRNVAASARRSTAQEEHRVAVGQTIEWLSKRTLCSDGPARFDDIAAFFNSLSRAPPPDVSAILPSGEARILLVLRMDPAERVTETIELSITRGRLETARSRAPRPTAAPARRKKPDLTIRADVESWLAIANGRPSAFDAIRTGRVTVTGETRLLPTLAKLIDAQGGVSGTAPPGHRLPD